MSQPCSKKNISISCLKPVSQSAVLALSLVTSLSACTWDSDEVIDPPSKVNDSGDNKSESDKGNAGKDDSGKGDAGKGNAGKGDAGKGDAGKGDAGKGDAGKGDAGKGDAGKGDAGKGNAGKGNAGKGNAGKGNAGKGNAGKGDSGKGDAGKGDAGKGNAGKGNAGKGNAGKGNAGKGNAGKGNAGKGNAGKGNAGKGNAGKGNAGKGNAGKGNAGKGNAGKGNAGKGENSDIDKDLKGWFVSPSGTPQGIGTRNSPWDLQTALNGGTNNKKVKAGDKIWLLSGQYNGRYTSLLNSNDPSKPITVASYPKNWAVLNGNVINPSNNAVLSVEGSHVIFKNFEVTHIGKFSRDKHNSKFITGIGINHKTGEDCKFVNLIVHDNPGVGVGSWKQTGGTEFYGNLVYNNGWLDFQPGKKRNHGPAFYVQNASDKTRLFENNIVFNNFSHGYEIWSANPKADKEYVKNISLINNSIFNNSLNFHSAQADVVISSVDKTGVNTPKNIVIKGGEIYKNNYKGSSGYGSAIRLNQFDPSFSALKDIVIEDNLLVSRNQGLVIGKTESLTFRNNLLVTGFLTVREGNQAIQPYKNWKFDNNTYYMKSNSFMRVNGDSQKKYSFEQWQSNPFNLDKQGSTFSGSQSKLAVPLSSQQRIRVVRNKYQPSRFKVSVFHGNGEYLNRNIRIDLSKIAGMEKFVNKSYKVIDVENYPKVVKTDTLGADKAISVNLSGTEFNYPRGTDLGTHKFNKTFKNYGVFWVDFSD